MQLIQRTPSQQQQAEAGVGSGAGTVLVPAAPAAGMGAPAPAAPTGGTPAPAAPSGAPAAAPAEPWYAKEDANTHETLKKYADQPAANKALFNAQKLIGKDLSRVIELPDLSNDTALGEVYAKLGRPDQAAQYQLPASMKDDPVLASSRDAAFAAGLSQKQFTAMAEQINKVGLDAQAKALETETAKFTTDIAAWRGELGNGVGRAESAVRAAAAEVGWDAATIDAAARGHPQGMKGVLAGLAKMGERLIEPRGNGTGSSNSNGLMSAGDAGNRLKEMARSADFQAKLKSGDMGAKSEYALVKANYAGYATVAEYEQAKSSGNLNRTAGT